MNKTDLKALAFNPKKAATRNRTTWFGSPPDVLQQRNDKGLCARSACQAPLTDGRWYNHGNYRYYCSHCATLINRHTHFSHELLCVREHDLQSLTREWEDMKFELSFELPEGGWVAHAHLKGTWEKWLEVEYLSVLPAVCVVYSTEHASAWVEAVGYTGDPRVRPVTSAEELSAYVAATLQWLRKGPAEGEGPAEEGGGE